MTNAHTQPELTELVFILDRSGSMSGLESDTIGGCNALIEKQKQESGEALVTTVLFDDKYELLHDRIPLKGIAPITDKQYFVRGCTALNDAMGKTINKIVNAQANTLECARPQKTLVAIITDGLENASREYTGHDIKKLVEARKEMGWEFLFIGANMDAIAAAKTVGIHADHAVRYRPDSRGTQVIYDAINMAAVSMRRGEQLDESWKQAVEVDFDARPSNDE